MIWEHLKNTQEYKHMAQEKKADMIIDLQYGSTGKGLIAGYLGYAHRYDTVISVNMPNAGHTYIADDGKKYVFKVLPCSAVSPTVDTVMIGPGAIFSMDQLKKEWDMLPNKDEKQLIIHETACVLRPDHAKTERSKLNTISSTMQGSMAAMVEKLERNQLDKTQGILVKENASSLSRIANHIVPPDEWHKILYNSHRILIEGAQGYSLGINAGFWPYCTSRDCTPARFLADASVPHNMLGHVIGSARCHPIRVGNTEGGYSGGKYPDQLELSWKDLNVNPEKTTVTGRVRRVFSFSEQQVKEAVMATQPNS